MATIASQQGGSAAALPFYPNPDSTEEWAADILADHGLPAYGPSDPRLKFVEGWITEEGTLRKGWNNPLDTSWQLGNSQPQNSAGVQAYATPAQGLAATELTLDQAQDANISTGLKTRGVSLKTLVEALALSNWSGSGPGSPEESGYAGAVGRLAGDNASDPTSTTTGTASTSAPQSTGATYVGKGAWLVGLDAALNPKASNDTLAQVLGPLDITADVGGASLAAETVAIRGGLFLAFGGVALIGLGLMFGRDLIGVVTGKGAGTGSLIHSVVGGAAAGGTAAEVSRLATARATSSEKARSAAQERRDAAAERREALRQQAISQRQSAAHDAALERERVRAANRQAETRAVGSRTRERIKLEETRGGTTAEQRRLVNARERAARNRAARKAA